MRGMRNGLKFSTFERTACTLVSVPIGNATTVQTNVPWASGGTHQFYDTVTNEVFITSPTYSAFAYANCRHEGLVIRESTRTRQSVAPTSCCPAKSCVDANEDSGLNLRRYKPLFTESSHTCFESLP